MGNEGMELIPAGVAPIVALGGIRKPKEILAEAATAAQELTKWMKAKVKPVIFNKEQYPEFEDWQLAGSFYHMTARATWSRPVQFGDVIGWEAGADVIDIRTGQIISSAESMCLNDEENWGFRPKMEWMYILKDGSKQMEDPPSDMIVWEDNPFKPGSKRPKKERVQVGEVKVPLFQLRSMAQTRACAKALRNVLSWIFVLAGFKPAVAEEMLGYDPAGAAPAKEAPISAAKVKEDPKPAQAAKDPVAAEAAAMDPAKMAEAAKGIPADLFPKAPANPQGQAQAAKPGPDADDVFTKLEKKLANYCDGDEKAMREKLMGLTSFEERVKDKDGKYTEEKTGKVIPGVDSVNELRKKKKTAWAGSALRKLEEELAGER